MDNYVVVVNQLVLILNSLIIGYILKLKQHRLVTPQNNQMDGIKVYYIDVVVNLQIVTMNMKKRLDEKK